MPLNEYKYLKKTDKVQNVSDKVFNMMQSVNKETDLVYDGYAEKAR